MINSSLSPAGSNRFHSINSFCMPRRLLARLYLLGVMAAIEFIACFPGVGLIFGHFRFPRIAIVSYAVFLGLGYSKLKAQREEIPFGRIYFGAHLVCIGAVLCSTLI